MRAWLLAAVLIATVAVATAAARGAAEFDLGDAPDGAKAGYTAKPEVGARFPARAANGGPRLAGGGPRIGTGWSGEADSRQVDRDGDDGATVTTRSCAVSTLGLALDLSRVEADTPVYVNAWFDWNQDGDWADGGNTTCGPEWGVQNQRVDRSVVGANGVALLQLRFRAGRAAEFWWRVTVHTGSPAPHAAGARVVGVGEVEDHRVGPTGAPGNGRLICRGILVAHGPRPNGPVSMDFDVDVPGHDERIGKGSLVVRLMGDTDGMRVSPVRHTDFVEVTIRTTKHTRRRIFQQAAIEVELRAVWPGGSVVLRARCPVVVVHSTTVIRAYRRPNVTVPAARVAINPNNPTPQTARCAARMDDGLDYFRVLTICRGADIKSTSVWMSKEPVSVWQGPSADWPRTFLKRCQPRFTGTNALKCYWNGGNKGLNLELRVNTPSTPGARFQVFILAGGHGEGGTAVVFEQTWYSLGGGEFRCLQTVPYATSCILAKSVDG